MAAAAVAPAVSAAAIATSTGAAAGTEASVHRAAASEATGAARQSLRRIYVKGSKGELHCRITFVCGRLWRRRKINKYKQLDCVLEKIKWRAGWFSFV
jgi:hypothetical protein